MTNINNVGSKAPIQKNDLEIKMNENAKEVEKDNSIFNKIDTNNDKSVDEKETLEYIKEKTGKQEISEKFLNQIKGFKINLKEKIGTLKQTAIINKINDIIVDIIAEETVSKNKELNEKQNSLDKMFIQTEKAANKKLEGAPPKFG